SIARAEGLGTNDRDLLWERKASEERVFGSARYPVHEAALVSLRTIAGRQYVVIKPTIVLSDGDPTVPRDAVESIKRAIFGWQHNAKFYAAMERWRQHMRGEARNGAVEFEWPPNCGSSFRFEVKKAPVFAGIVVGGGRAALRLDDKTKRHVTQKGI